jgi:small subunit ribosomal protein S5
MPARRPFTHRRPRPPQEPKEFEEKVLQVNRVSKKTKGGNRIGFSVLVVVGDRKGRVGAGLGKAPEVATAIRKGISYAKKHFVHVPLKGATIPHQVTHKFKAAKVLLKPAPDGSGLIAGGPIRAVANAAGIHNLSAKILGSRNAITNVYCTLEALKMLKPPPEGSKKPTTEKKTTPPENTEPQQ